MTYIHFLNKSQSKYALAALTILVAGCSSQPPTSTNNRSILTPVISQGTYKTLEQQLIDASRTQYPRRAELILPITKELLKNNPTRAKELLDQMPYDDLPMSLQARLSVQQATIAEDNNHSWDVFNWLDREPVIVSEDPSVQSQAYILKAKAYSRFGENQAALDEWLTGLPMLNPAERTQYHDAFWQTLLHTPSERLQELYSQPLSKDMRGWIALAQIYQPGKTLERQLSSLQTWQQEWPSHPASSYLPKNFENLRNSAMQRPKKVAVLLPLTGGLSKAGRSVRDGIIAANYESPNHSETDQSSTEQPELAFYDTDNREINELVSEAIDNGAQLIIGPLSRTNVAKLNSDATRQVPILALNYLDDETSAPSPGNLYQFGLSAEDEAHMAAQRAYLDGHQRALVLTPNTDWGKKINDTFIETWRNLGGELAGSAQFQPKTEFSQFTGRILHTDQSQNRAKQLNRQLGETLGFRPRRRQDVDMIFIGANPSEARQLKPALAYQFAATIPVYSTSNAFSGTTNPNQDQDMDGIRIPIMPWLIPGTETQVEQKITHLWPQSRGQYGTLYALGADAYRLYPYLQQLSSLQGSQIHGLTGQLSITPSGKVQRRLTWRLFKNGRLVPLPVVRPEDNAKAGRLNHVLAAKPQ
ncbi:hypothetical protein ACH42_17470 [Endozoicomonas sp. (ex Bugula neritina AB1)]|nr:hypothetical protein ACH42_17470 [Endozoicomonas sp. (ex Bugula neritina AB1)]